MTTTNLIQLSYQVPTINLEVSETTLLDFDTDIYKVMTNDKARRKAYADIRKSQDVPAHKRYILNNDSLFIA